MIKLRRASIKDAELITSIKVAAYNDDFNRFGPTSTGGPPEYDSILATKQGIEENLYYTICLDEKIIGSFWLNQFSNSECELEDFVIDPDYHKRGYGRKTLKLMEDLHPEFKIWTLGTPVFSERNRHLYESHGYKESGKSDDGFLVFYRKDIF